MKTKLRCAMILEVVNFLDLKVIFCEQEFEGVNTLPEVPKIETFRVPSDGATALNSGFGPGPSAGYHRQGPGPIFVLRQGREKARSRVPTTSEDKRDTSLVHGHRRKRARKNGSLRRERSGAPNAGGAGIRLAACRSSSAPLCLRESRASAQITIHEMRMR